MPVIKQWLYSDKDIFVREMVSNGCDAVSKHKRLVATGEAPKDDAPYRVDVGDWTRKPEPYPSATTVWA